MMAMAMTLRLTDDETEALRSQAEAEGRSMQDIARAAVREYVDRRTLRTKVEHALDELAPRYADLLDRLGQ
jgi:predicted transcriptional regulator